MIKTQIQLPDELYHALKRVAASREWSLAETLRRGAEHVVATHPVPDEPPENWRLPEPINLDLVADPFADSAWREDVNLGSPAARLTAQRLREEAARYEA